MARLSAFTCGLLFGLGLLLAGMADPAKVLAFLDLAGQTGRVPLLWILGRHDLYFSPERAMRDTGLPHNAEVVILEKSGHLGFIEEADMSAGLIGSFAQKLEW